MAKKKRKKFKEVLKDIKKALFNEEISPHDRAMSAAIGMFIAFSPFLGFHNLMAISLALLSKKIDKILIIGFTWVNNPWTTVPMYLAGLKLGELICCPHNPFDISSINWHIFTLSNFLNGKAWHYLVNDLKAIIFPFFIGSLILGIVAAILTYIVILIFLKRREGNGTVSVNC